MGLLLHPLKLPKQKHRRILNGVLLALFLQGLGLLLDYMCEDGVIDGEAIDGVELLDQFETHGASYPPVPAWMHAYM